MTCRSWKSVQRFRRSAIRWIKKGPPHDQKHVVIKHDDFPITFSIRFYNSLYYRTSRDTTRNGNHSSFLAPTDRKLHISWRFIVVKIVTTFIAKYCHMCKCSKASATGDFVSQTSYCSVALDHTGSSPSCKWQWVALLQSTVVLVTTSTASQTPARPGTRDMDSWMPF